MKESRRNRRNGFSTVQPEGEKILQTSRSIIVIVAIVLIGFVLVFGSTYQIREQEQAV